LKVTELLKNKQFLSLAGNIVMTALNLVTGSILYRNLSQEAMGCWVFFQTVFILIDTFRTGFLQTSFVKFYAGTEKGRGENVLGSTWLVGLMITGAVIVANLGGLLFLPYIKDLVFIVIVQWTSLFFISTLPIVMATWLLQAQQRYSEILYIRVVNQASFIISVIALIYFKKLDLEMVLLFNVSCNLLTCLYVFLRGWTGIKALPKQSRAAMIEIYNFGKFSVGTSISANLLRYSDTIIIKFALGDKFIAIYGVAQNLTNFLDIPLRSFVTTGMTSLAEAENRKDKEEVSKIFKMYSGALTVLFIPAIIFLLLFADVAVGLLGGGKYAHGPAANLFRIFLAMAIFLPIDRFIGVTLDVMHKPKINFYKVLLMLAINVAGDLTAVYIMHSLYGIAVASIPTFVIGTLFGYFSLKRYLQFDMLEIVKLGWVQAQVIVKMMVSKVGGTKPAN